MGRGRKPISILNNSEWEAVFYNSVGAYVRYINNQLSKEYKLEPLSNHFKIIGGYAFKAAEYKKQGIPIIRISDFNNEQIVLKDVVYYQESKELDRFQLVEGDIIIALTGGTIAKLAIVQAGLGKIYLNQRVGKFQVLNPDEFELEYIYWLARSIQSIIKNLAWGAAIPNVSPKQIEELKFPFPTKEIQKGIVSFLNDLKNNEIKEGNVYFNEIIENDILSLHEKQINTNTLSIELTHQLALVKQLRQSFLREAMQGKLTIDFRSAHPELIEGENSAQALLEMIKVNRNDSLGRSTKKEKELAPIGADEMPFEIPDGWVWCRLLNAGKITGGGTPSMANADYWNGNIPWVSPKDMWTELVSDTEMKVTFKGIRESSTNLIPVGSLLIVGRSGILKRKLPVAINTVECTVNQDMKVIIPYILKMNRYIQFMLGGLESTVLKDFVKFGMTVHSLKYDEFAKMPIPLPPLSEQQAIVSKLDELMRTCDELEASIHTSQQQNEMLLREVLREALEKPKEEIREVLMAAESIPTYTIPRQSIIPDNKRGFAKQVLGGKIVEEFKDDKNFTNIKFQKLQYLAEQIIEENLEWNYYRQMAGPYDNKFMHSVFNRLEKNSWFRKSGNKYQALGKVNDIDKYYQNYFGDKSEKLNNLFGLLQRASEKFCEAIATIYAVWNNHIILKQEYNKERVKADFFDWSNRKTEVFTEEEFEKALVWMQNHDIIPTGFGYLIKDKK